MICGVPVMGCSGLNREVAVNCESRSSDQRGFSGWFGRSWDGSAPPVQALIVTSGSGCWV